MRLGMSLRTMGDNATRDVLVRSAQLLEAAGFDDLFVPDHIAIPPDDAEGSGGRYLDPLGTLLFLAGHTERIGLGVGVLVLPYRPALATAKVVATLQELSGGRFVLGVGVGWMEAEFRAVGVASKRRGRITDETLDFFERAFASDRVESNGQPLLFLPRPQRPPILVGGRAQHALARAARYGDGWMPMSQHPEKLRAPIQELRERFAAAGKPAPDVAVMTSLPAEDRAQAEDALGAWQEVGATRVIDGHSRFAHFAELEERIELLGSLRAVLTGGKA